MNGPQEQAPAGLWGRIAGFFVGIGRRLRSMVAFPFQVLHWEVRRLRAEVTEFGTATTESMAHLGLRLERIESSLRRLEEEGRTPGPEALFALRSLVSVDPPARVLEAGARSGSLAPSLASLGYEVTVVGRAEDALDGSAASGRFDAILCGPIAGAADLDRLDGLLAEGGLVVFAAPVTNQSEAGAGEALPRGWSVEDRLVIREAEIALVAARRLNSD